MSDRPGLNTDGSVDYSRYNEEQLFRALRSIDSERYPLNFANLKAAFAARQIPIDDSLNAADALMAAERLVFSRPAPRPVTEYPIAFAPRPGFLTWLGPSRNDFRLVGVGGIEVHAERVSVRGRRFGFILGLPLMRRVEIHKGDITNVEVAENVVRFECHAGEGKLKSLTFWVADSTVAEDLVHQLPAERMPDFVPQLASYLDFEEHLENRAPRLPVTSAFAILSLLMFCLTIYNGAEWFNATGVVQIAWGSNFSPSTLSGQWWRLLTYSFLHYGIFHLAFNLWALASFGAIAERLYGSLRYASICFVSAIVGGMASLAMAAQINSAGASGVLFGIFGALLVSEVRGTEPIPESVKRSLRNSTLFFALVSLISGFLFKGIDNGAHIGGLVAGIFMGMAFQSPRRIIRIVAPVTLVLFVAVTGAGLAKRAQDASPVEASYWEEVSWFVTNEPHAVASWQEVQRLARANAMEDVPMAEKLTEEVLPFWQESTARFAPFKFHAGTEVFDSHEYMKRVAGGRLHAIEQCISGLRAHDVGIVEACMKEMGEVDQLIRAREEKLKNNSNAH